MSRHREKPMDTEMWTVAFEDKIDGETLSNFDVYLDPEWHNGDGPLCVTLRVVNSGMCHSIHEISPASLKKTLKEMVKYIDEMIDKREDDE